MLEPGAEAACAASASGRIAVLATEGTVCGGAYQAAIHALRPTARVIAQACQLFVALTEEGWVDGPLVTGIVQRYLEPIFRAPAQLHPDCLLLGCTHFPVLQAVFSAVVGPSIAIVDSAATTAAVVQRMLGSARLNRDSGTGTMQLLATDGPARFARVGGTFLGERIDPQGIETVDL